MEDKFITALVSFLSVYLLAELPDLDIFPTHLFSFSALVYGIMGSLVYTVLDVFRKLKAFDDSIEGTVPIKKMEMLLILFRIIGAGILNIVLYAVLLSYLRVSQHSWLDVVASKEGAILIGIGIGFLFEFLASKDVKSIIETFAKNKLKNWVNKEDK